MPDMFDVVELIVDAPEQGLYAGLQGTIVMRYPGEAYEVEFTDQAGVTRALLALRPHEFVVVWRASAGAPVPIAEQIAALVEALPEDAGREVLDFARFLKQRRHSLETQRVSDSAAGALAPAS